MTRTEQIERALEASLQRITPANGYITDAGLRVFIGHDGYTDDTPSPLIVVDDVQDDFTALRNGGRRGRLTFNVQGWVAGTDRTARAVAYDLAQDLKRSLFTPGTELQKAAMGPPMQPSVEIKTDPLPGASLTLVECSVALDYEEALS